MAAYSELQQAEFAAEAQGYTATKHQREVGTGYFDAVSLAITGGKSSTTAMHDSTETAQFQPDAEASRGGVNPTFNSTERDHATYAILGHRRRIHLPPNSKPSSAGTERLVGPFDSKGDAERTWRYLSEDHRPQAQVRLHHRQEPLGVAHS